MKLTKTTAERIVTAIDTTKLPLSRVASYSGITYQTLRNWLRNGEEHLQQLTEGKINKSDLNAKQKKELDLYQRVADARSAVETGYIEKIHEIAEKKEDIKAYQWLLKMQNPVYRDNHIDKTDAESKAPELVIVVHLSDCGGQQTQLLSEFLNGTMNDGKQIQGGNEDTGDGGKS